MNNEPQRLDVRFTITWEAGWHVGSGRGTATADRLLRRRACGPHGERLSFVPGSQIKGVLRHHCDRLVALLGGAVVSPHVVRRETDPELLGSFGLLERSRMVIDRLFGSRFQGDCLFVEDALPAETAPQTHRLHSRTAIDRVSGTAREQTLFTTEVAPARQSVLEGRVQARHVVRTLTQDGEDFPFEYALLLAGLLSLDALGGDKSTGLGRCQVAIPGETVRWNYNRSFPLASALQSFEVLGDDWFAWLQNSRGEK